MGSFPLGRKVPSHLPPIPEQYRRVKKMLVQDAPHYDDGERIIPIMGIAGI
jgi:hypothetical protein